MTREAIIAYTKSLKIKYLNEIKFKLAILYKTEAINYFKQQHYDKAIESLKQSVENDPSQDESWELIGDIYSKEKKYELAINAFDKANIINPRDDLKVKIFSLSLEAGEYYYKKGDIIKAEDAFRIATKVDPQNAIVWAYLGDVLYAQQKFNEAEIAYREAIKIDPNLASSWNGLGNVLAQQNKFKEASEAYHEAIKIDPNLASSWNGLGNVLAQQNKSKEAIDAYNRATKIDPNLASSWVGLGNVLYQQQKYRESRICFNKAKEHGGKVDDIIDSLSLKIELERLLSPMLNEKNNVALLLDTSSSMEGQKINDAKEVVKKAIDAVPARHNAINLIFFSGSIYPYSLESNSPTESRKDLKYKIDRIAANGNTSLHGALKKARLFLENKNDQVIIIVTDGMPNDATPDEILSYAKKLKNDGCKMISFGIGKGNEINEDFLKKIASNENDFYLIKVNLDAKSVSIVYIYQAAALTYNAAAQQAAC